jgi:hypothetical protein
MKSSIDIPADLMNRVKEYNQIHKDRPINVSGVVEMALELILADSIPVIDAELIKPQATTKTLPTNKNQKQDTNKTTGWSYSSLKKCPNCGKENIVIPGGKGRKCTNCGTLIKANTIKIPPDKDAPALQGEGSGVVGK